MDPDAVERKLAAILSADVVGYSRLMAEDEEGTVRTLAAYRDEIALLVTQHRGRVMDFTGDNFLAEFPTATEAVESGVEIQRVLGARNAALPSGRMMLFRIGIHLGEVRVEEGRLYGDGVNIAARLEGLAEAGGVCISATVHEQVRRKLDVGYEDLGKQTLKNIPEPVRVYRVRLNPEGATATETLPRMDELTVSGFAGRPAVAVLPFDNLSGDAEQEYFADGIVEDLITRLSTWCRFPVIARNSSFVYKGKAVDVKQVSQELGVRYVVEGSVRKAGERVRISVQLIDATTGHHVWAERYDRELQDIFALQDEITEAIGVSIEPELLRFESERAIRREPQNLGAYECWQRGMWHFNRWTKDDNAKARRFFEKAAELVPHLVEPVSMLPVSLYIDIANQWTDSSADSVDKVVRAAERSVALDDQDPYAQLASGVAFSLTQQSDKMLAAFQRAIQLNPSLAQAYGLMGILAFAGRPDEAIPNLEKAIRLSPRDQLNWVYLYGMAMAHFFAERYEDAVDWAQRSVQRRPDWAPGYRCLAASYAYLGRDGEARAALQELLRLQPEFSSAQVRLVQASAGPALVQRFIDGLHKAGLKE